MLRKYYLNAWNRLLVPLPEGDSHPSGENLSQTIRNALVDPNPTRLETRSHNDCCTIDHVYSETSIKRTRTLK